MNLVPRFWNVRACVLALLLWLPSQGLASEPELKIPYLSDGAIVTNVLSIQVERDPSIQLQFMRMDIEGPLGVHLASTAQNPPDQVAFVFDTTQVEDGYYTIMVTAIDAVDPTRHYSSAPLTVWVGNFAE